MGIPETARISQITTAAGVGPIPRSDARPNIDSFPTPRSDLLERRRPPALALWRRVAKCFGLSARARRYVFDAPNIPEDIPLAAELEKKTKRRSLLDISTDYAVNHDPDIVSAFDSNASPAFDSDSSLDLDSGSVQTVRY
ncbi:hypothetical protein EVAR_67712_1 [Eumeta japonica]|uniref:Uncharacterized protein n=1 Tax=Eumeta variegata TaxID=151549 RepID=A0A4C1ZY59_EUMVA|nr:hypothetical protein EVAR_67712_1 [Eumeta japonica]